MDIVADVLSRDPFARTVGQRLITESYDNLHTESEEVEHDGVQDLLRLKVQCLQTERSTQEPATKSHPPSFSCNQVVEALLDAHDRWDAAT